MKAFAIFAVLFCTPLAIELAHTGAGHQIAAPAPRCTGLQQARLTGAMVRTAPATHVEGGLLVPRAALIRRSGTTSVLVDRAAESGGAAESDACVAFDRRTIGPAQAYEVGNGDLLITDGLRRDDRIVVDGALLISDLIDGSN